LPWLDQEEMDSVTGTENEVPLRPSTSSGAKRNLTGTSLLSKIPFMRNSHADLRARNEAEEVGPRDSLRQSPQPQQQQPKTRRRRGSLRKVALLGRGAQRERRDSKSPSIEVGRLEVYRPTSNPAEHQMSSSSPTGLGIDVPEREPRPGMDGFDRPQPPPAPLVEKASSKAGSGPQESEPSPSRYSTSDEDALHMGRPHAAPPVRQVQGPTLSSGSDSSLAPPVRTVMRRPSRAAKSPLGLAAPLAAGQEADWDYAETEWWGWVVLVVTWFVFVTGMGSCLGAWSWVWDVGTTPYAPPELEDDPTLPIVGYYPALMILTCVMAWAWVLIAWVGMKYFRHAKISGD
jgi:hypothetical protein